MAPPNPYFIYIELFKADGVTRPNQNEIARVRAYDVNGAAVTWEGESGFNPNTGGWYPVYMQNIAAFYPPREKPNLRFEVWNTAEQLVYTTQVFNNIPSASTVKIVIGVSAEIVGGSSSTWTVFGTVRRQDSSLLTSGVVRVYDITNGSEKLLGTTTLGSSGTYSVSYTTADFTNNGSPHAQPNLTVRVYSPTDQLLGQTGPQVGSNNHQMDVTVPNEVPTPGTQRRVFGDVKNTVGLPVSGIFVEAYHLAWTVQGLQEFRLGSSTPVTSNGSGAYEILYDAPIIGTPENPCGTPAGQINLIVYALESAGGPRLFTSDVVFDAPPAQRVDLTVNKQSASTDSEYRRIHDAINPCLGDTDAGRFSTLNRLNERAEYLTFVAKATGVEQAKLRAYVKAWLIAGEINAKVPLLLPAIAPLSRPMAPEVIYALVRVLEAHSLAELLNVLPEGFFDAIVRAVRGGIVSTAIETALYPSTEFGNKSLLDDWREVLARLLNQVGVTWQAQLLNLVFKDYKVFPSVLASAGTPFASTATGHNVPIPAGVVEGDLLIILFANAGAATASIPSPAGWVQIFGLGQGSTNQVRFTGFAKRAAAGEPSTVNVVTSVAAQGAAHVYRIAKDSWYGGAVDTNLNLAAAQVGGTGTSADPTSLNPGGWVTGKTLWLACAGHSQSPSLSSSPASYTPIPALRTPSSGSAGNCTVLSSRRELEVESENPGAFGLSASANWVAATVGIREGLVSFSAKREAVVRQYFDHQGTFAELVAAVRLAGHIDANDEENLNFVFDLYEAVGRWYPIVAAVYGHKQTEGWNSIRDLAKVSLADWIIYASEAQSHGGFPLDVPGSNGTDKANVYGTRLYELFRVSEPQDTFTDDLGASAGSNPVIQEVADFLADPNFDDFDLDRTNVEEYVEKNATGLSPDAVEKLKQYQRVYRLTPDLEAINALIADGLDSAVKIARYDEGAFIAAYEDKVGGLTKARNIHRVASYYAAEVMFTLVKFNQNLNDVGGMEAVPGAVDFTVLDPRHGLLDPPAIDTEGDPDTRKFPNWITLFGSLNQCACKHCQTVLSPGAYFVDLLEFVAGAPKRTLFERRPDLEDIELTCANTNTVLPYIDLVNEVLEAVISPLGFTLSLSPNVIDVMDGASDGVESEIAKVRAAFAVASATKQAFVLGERMVVKKGAADAPGAPTPYREWLIEDESWRFSIRQTGATFTVFPSPQTNENNDSLEVFPEHFNELAYKKLAEAIFPFNLPLDLGREETEVFLKAKNVAHSQVLEAFDARTFAQKLADGRVARAYLRLSQAEASAILGQTATLHTLWGFEAASAEIPRPDKPTVTIEGNWVDLMTLVPVFLHRSGLSYQELLDLLDTEFVHRFAADDHGLHLAAPDAALAECNVDEFQIAHLTAQVLQRISFFVRLWRKLGWTMRELDRYLVQLSDNHILVPGDASGDATIVRLFQVRRLCDELGLTPRAVFAFFRPIHTRRTERNPKSLFDELFLNGLPTQPELIALERVARGEVVVLSTLPAETDLRAHVRGALGLKSEDIDLLWSRFVGDASGASLNLEKLTGIFRNATLATALGLSVRELFDFEALIVEGTILPEVSVDVSNLTAAIALVHVALRELRVARTARISAAEMHYYLTDAHDPEDPFTPLAKDLEAAAQRLASAASEIAAANPEQPNPDATVLATALGKVIPLDKVVRAIQIIEAPDDTDADQIAFVERYFGSFVSTTPAAFLAALEGVPLPPPPVAGAQQDPIPVRYRFVFDALHAALIEDARKKTAIDVAAELAGVDTATANTLLTQSLYRPGSTTVSAIEDWKRMLSGGFVGGETTPVDLPGQALARVATFVASKGGEHRFVASVNATSGITADNLRLWIDGVLQPASSPVVGDGRMEVVFGPISLRAGSAHALELLYTGTGVASATLTLLLRVENADAAVVPSTALVPLDNAAYLKLWKAARFTRGLALTKAELRYLVETPEVFDLNALPLSSGADVPWSKLSTLLELLALNRGVKLKDSTLLEFLLDTVPGFAALSESEVLDAVAAQTGWKRADLEAALTVWSTPDWDDPALWFLLRDVFTVVRRLDLRASQILSTLVTGSPSIASAATLRNVFRAQFTKQTWKEIFKPLRDPLRQRVRDALVGYLTTRPVNVPEGPPRSFFDENDLFAFYLIDVEMEPDTVISRLKLALNVVQLFVERVFLGLEDAASLGELEKKKDQWTWMERYRVWEANRKVFLYPENWIEPELREDKTEFFKELEDELLQAPVTHETAMTALAGYLEKMNEVSNLEIVGAYAEGKPADGGNYFLHLVGRTRFRSRSLFYRTFQGRQAHDGTFSPWKRINLEIDADVITPLVVNGRLHLFWPKVVTKEKPQEHDVAGEGAVAGSNPNAFDSEKRVRYQAEIRLMWSEYIPAKNKWTKPKLSKSRAVDENAPTPFSRDIGEDQARTENYHLRVETSSEQVLVHLIRTEIPAANGSLQPKRLGTFQIWHSGDDTYITWGDQPWSLGNNWPVGTLLKHNAAFETSLTIDNTVSSDMLQFRGSAPFFARTPEQYRIFATNLGFFSEDNQPFFYETLTKSFLGLSQGRETITGMSDQTTLSVRFSTFHHPLVQTFEQKLQQFGLGGLMHRLTEALPVADDRYYANYYYNYYYGSLYLGYHIAGDTRALYTTQRMFEQEHGPGSQSVDPLYPLPTVEFGYGTSFGIYNWELFFHVPMLIANRLTQELRFEDALNWYHCVFDPKQELNRYEQTQRWVDALPQGSRYWTFLPFFANKKTTDSLLATLGLTKTLTAYEHAELAKLIDEWRRDPFKPHLIARQRMSAYQKFVVMKYLDNLIAWADQLFRQDTFETINEATQLYILADELLGRRPENVEPLTGSPRLTYRELQAKGIGPFSNAIVDVESLIVGARPHLKDTELPPLGSNLAPVQNMGLKSFYFRIPRNERLDRYWDTVQDRLFKIRNSMNIDGVKRRLSLFEPPIDPALLVRAAAAGLDLGSVLAQLNAPLPCYRFSVWVQKATELCNELKGFGAALLAALEKKDAEALQLLRQGHEIRMLELVRRVREQQVKEAEENITALELSRALAEERHEFYRTRVKVSGGESAQIGLTIASTALETGQGILHATAGLFGAVPDSIFGMVGPFPTGLAQVKIGTAGTTIATSAASALGVAASITRGLSNIAGLTAGHERRWDDWKLQERLAQKEITQLNQQIAVARIRLDIAEKELANHERQIEHAAEVLEFLEDKFTNRDLYSWMVSQLSRTYNQVYKLAYEAARTAERTFEFELGTTGAGFIQFDYVDSLRQGLLAGEKLIYDLKRLDVAYLERNKRELEIQKPISLSQLDAGKLQELRETGSCEFELPEVLFDLDFPGQYFRRIKGVRLTIPCVTGPHTSVSAKLTLTGSAYRKESAVGPSYAYTGFDDARFVHDPIGITSIATGRAQGDPGMFEFNFRDERYLPFEGAGAISRWRLELPTEYRQFDYNTISDVVLDLSYTARDGGGLLKVGAETAIVDGLNRIRELAVDGVPAASGLARAFSLKKEFPDVFHRLLTEESATLTLTKEHFPFVVRDARLSMAVVPEENAPDHPVRAHVIPKPGATLPSDIQLGLNSATLTNVNVSTGIGLVDLSKGEAALVATASEDWELAQSGLPVDAVDDIVLIVNYAVTAPASP